MGVFQRTLNRYLNSSSFPTRYEKLMRFGKVFLIWTDKSDLL
jgi:hypothetical protein